MDHDAEDVQRDAHLHHSVAGFPPWLWHLHHRSHLHPGAAEGEASHGHLGVRSFDSFSADVRRTVLGDTG